MPCCERSRPNPAAVAVSFRWRIRSKSPWPVWCNRKPIRPGFTLSTALRSLLRQDPEVILVGEIRDRETAEVFLQASLTDSW